MGGRDNDRDLRGGIAAAGGPVGRRPVSADPAAGRGFPTDRPAGGCAAGTRTAARSPLRAPGSGRVARCMDAAARHSATGVGLAARLRRRAATRLDTPTGRSGPATRLGAARNRRCCRCCPTAGLAATRKRGCATARLAATRKRRCTTARLAAGGIGTAPTRLAAPARSRARGLAAPAAGDQRATGLAATRTTRRAATRLAAAAFRGARRAAAGVVRTPRGTAAGVGADRPAGRPGRIHGGRSCSGGVAARDPHRLGGRRGCRDRRNRLVPAVRRLMRRSPATGRTPHGTHHTERPDSGNDEVDGHEAPSDMDLDRRGGLRSGRDGGIAVLRVLFRQESWILELLSRCPGCGIRTPCGTRIPRPSGTPAVSRRRRA